MTAAGLVDRLALPSDGRGALLVASKRARQLLDRYDRASSQVLRATLHSLPAADRRAVQNALPALHRLLAALSE